MRGPIVASISVVILVGAMLCSSDGQVYMGTNWLRDLNENINALNRNLQQNMHQLQQRIHNTVQRNLEQVHRLTENLDNNSNNSMIQMIGGNSVVISNNDGTKIVQSGRTSDGKPYIRESTDKIIGDTLQHIERIYDPITNTSKMHGYTLNLKDPSAKPVPLNDTA